MESKLKKTSKLEILFKLFIIMLVLLLFGSSSVYAAASTSAKSTESTSSKDMIWGDPLEDPKLFQENKDYVDIYNNVTWKKTNVYYWQVNTKNCLTSWSWPWSSNYGCSQFAHSYIFTRIEDEEGNPITDIRYIKYTYVDKDDNIIEVDTKPTSTLNSSYYKEDGNFIKLSDIRNFGENDKATGDFYVPGLSSRKHKEMGFIPAGTCDVAHNQEDIRKLEFVTDNYSNVKPYEDTNFLLYFPRENIKHLVYIYCWYMETNLETGKEELIGGSFAQNGEHILLDENGNATGVYDLEGNLLPGYSVTNSGIPCDEAGNYLIDESDQKKGSIDLKPTHDMGDFINTMVDGINNDLKSLFDKVSSTSDKIMNGVKIVAIVSVVIASVGLLLYLIYLILKLIRR